MKCMNNIKCSKHKEDWKMNINKENNGESYKNKKKKNLFSI